MTYLYGIGISTGRRVPLMQALDTSSVELGPRQRAWLAEPGRTVEVKALAEDGFEYYVESEAGISGLAREAMGASLAAGATPADEIDAVVLSTESFWDFEDPVLRDRFDP